MCVGGGSVSAIDGVSQKADKIIIILFFFLLFLFSGFRLIPEAKTDLVDGENENVTLILPNKKQTILLFLSCCLFSLLVNFKQK